MDVRTQLILLVMVSEAFSQGIPVASYDHIVDRIEDCEDPGTKDFVASFKVRKVDAKNKGYTGTISLKVPVDEKVDAEFRADRLLHGGWSKNAFIVRQKHVCEFIRTKSPENFKEAANLLGIEEACPIPAGEYPITDYVPKIELPFPALPEGYYRSELNFRNSTHLLGCIMIYADIVLSSAPKKMPFK